MIRIMFSTLTKGIVECGETALFMVTVFQFCRWRR